MSFLATVTPMVGTLGSRVGSEFVPPEPRDFDLPPKLRIDTAALEKDFYRLSREYHPDRFAAKPAAEQAAATERASLLNDAYRTLRDPIRRTEYLLEQNGVELEEQSVRATEQARAAGEQKKQIVPPDLLEEAFELNMQLEEMKMAVKTGEDDPQLRKDLQAAQANFTALLEQSQRSAHHIRSLVRQCLWPSWRSRF